MIPVTGGTFTMGSPESEVGRREDECQHQVTVKSFSIGKYEVTQADWFEIMGARPSYNKNCEECPVENVSWNDIQDFLKALNKKYPGKNYRLPSEAEWEYAARGGNKSQGYLYAGSNDLKKVAWYSSNSGSKTHPVGELIANELSIFDMSGNVYEWCQDYYKAYPNCKAYGSEGVTPVIRGGGWDNSPQGCHTAYRSGKKPAGRDVYLGFRLAL
ncbi:MAG: formylglycine-generating enzyme family protein [Lewinellaceae bacterium]|nr:formylglycine-generating enzyme family protein [Lewinellaceae bacterium]